MEKEFRLEDFIEAINELERQDVAYFVFGGFAIEAVNRTGRKFHDLDIIFFGKDKEKVIRLFRGLGYTTYTHGRKHDYRREKAKVDALFLEDKGDYYELHGNLCLDRISKEAFRQIPRLRMGEVEFRVMPYEWFSLYRTHYKPEKQEDLERFVGNILPLCKRVPILEQIEVEKPENMRLMEIGG
ncbi:hypothetical protein HYW76_00560 [Candidatus Pacearchaeota archaeon]|nr:hypothetical protein [Candidatus Pacearchaeota archaeon]